MTTQSHQSASRKQKRKPAVVDNTLFTTPVHGVFLSRMGELRRKVQEHEVIVPFESLADNLGVSQRYHLHVSGTPIHILADTSGMEDAQTLPSFGDYRKMFPIL